MRSFSTVALTLACACSADVGVADESDGDLVGGVGAASVPPGMVGLHVECGAVKIGPREFLTAGHCVVRTFSEKPQGGGTEPQGTFERGQKLCVHPTTQVTATSCIPLQIVWTKIHPSYAKFIQTHDPHHPDASINDLAIFRVAEFTSTIPVAVRETRALVASDVIMMTGYGCTTIPGPAGGSESIRILRTAETRVDSTNEKVFLTAPGNKIVGCPGDSGSPVYAKASDGQLKIVGINSYLRNDRATGMAKLDSKSKAGGWITNTVALP